MHPYQQLLQQFSQYQQQATPNGQPTELYEPVAYIMSLGGKRMRPLLALVGCHLYTDDIPPALPIAFAMELFHNFSLVHDDIMDNAHLRRNQPTVHEKFGTNTAILSGDVMLVYVYERLMEAPAPILTNLLHVFNRTAIQVCEGQQMDMNFETRADVTEGEYIHMITYKTAVLLGCSLQLGALVGGGKAAEAEKLYQYGLNMGIAFQIQDDLLDTFGTEAVGKEIGGDIRQNKQTILLIKAKELAKGEDKTLLAAQLQSSNVAEKISAVTALYLKLGVKDIAEDLMRTYHKKALAVLEDIDADPNKKALLRDYANQLLVRQQ